MAEHNAVSNARRGQVNRDQWYAELLRLAQEDGHVESEFDSNEDALAASAEFAGRHPYSPSRVPGGSEASALAPSPVWDECFKAELSPVEALEGALAAADGVADAFAEAEEEAAAEAAVAFAEAAEDEDDAEEA